MGLKVWLPLNGNLENKGCDSLILSNIGATVATGKIGNCYSFNGSSNYMRAQYPASNYVQNMSFCCWVKLNNITSNMTLISSRKSTGYGMSVFILSGKIRFDNGQDSSQSQTAFSTSLTANKWQHICVVQNATNRQLYINGVLKETISATAPTSNTAQYLLIGGSSGSDSTPTGNWLNGYLNDVRIYNHCLSAAEVHEISQGLVLHYKFDDLPQNYTKNTNTSWTNFTIGQWYTTIFSYSMSDFIAATGARNGDKFTWSIDINGIGGTKNLSARVQHYNNGSDRTSVIGNAIPAGNKGRSSVTFTLNTSYAQLDFMITNSSSGTVTNNTTEQYKNTRIQYGDVVTGWVPKGMTQTIIDSSGYSNYGIPNGTLILSSNTTRYHASTFFNGTDSVISAPSVSTIKAYSFWLKLPNLTVGKCIFADTLSHLAFALSTSNHITVASYTNATYKQTYTLNNLTANQWQHVIVQWNIDSSDVELYINGMAATKNGTTQNMYQQDTAAKLTIGARKLNGIFNNFSSCSISDFRAYTTHLSTDDIQTLYHTGARIDNKQTLHTFELNESNPGRELLAVPLTTAYNSDTIRTNYDTNGEITLTGKVSVGSDYIKINPVGKKYYFDVDLTVAARNSFYIGFQRYDASKSSRSNDATMYMLTLRPSANEVHKHYHLVWDTAVAISNQTTNFGYFDSNTPVDTIRLRILNDWSNSNARKATIHSISFREVPSLQNTKINKKGQVITDELIEMNVYCRIQKNGIVETPQIIEI